MADDDAKKPDLQFVTTHELFDEIRTRYHGALLIVRKEETEKNEGVEFWYSGGSYQALGLAEYARANITHRLLFEGEHEDRSID